MTRQDLAGSVQANYRVGTKIEPRRQLHAVAPVGNVNGETIKRPSLQQPHELPRGISTWRGRRRQATWPPISATACACGVHGSCRSPSGWEPSRPGSSSRSTPDAVRRARQHDSSEFVNNPGYSQPPATVELLVYRP